MKLHLSVNFDTLNEILHQKGNQWKRCMHNGAEEGKASFRK